MRLTEVTFLYVGNVEFNLCQMKQLVLGLGKVMGDYGTSSQGLLSQGQKYTNAKSTVCSSVAAVHGHS